MTVRRVVRFLLLAAVTVMMVVAGGWLLFRDDMEARIRVALQDYARSRAQEAMGVDVNGRRTIRVGSLDYRFLEGRLDVRDVDIVVSSRTPSSSDSIRCRIATLTCSGLSWWDVLVGDGLDVGDVDIRGVALVRWQHRDSIEEAPPAEAGRLPRLPNVDSLVRDAVRTSLPPAVRSLSIASLTIAVDSLRSFVAERGMATATTYRRIDVRITDVGLHPKGLPFAELAVRIDRMDRHFHDGRSLRLYGPTTVVPSLGHTVLSIDSLTWHAADGYRSWAAGVLFDEAASRLSADSVRIRPALSDAVLCSTAVQRLDRFDISMGRTVCDGLDLAAILAGTGLHVKRIAVQGLALDVLSTKWQPRRRSATSPPMPAAMLLDAPFDIMVDTITAWKATIAYHEQPRAGRPPGTLFWNDVELLVTDVRRGGQATIGARAAFMGSASMEASIVLDLRSRTHDLRASGRLGGMSLTNLNRFLPPTEGVRIREGHVDGITFDLHVRGRSATGWVLPIYRDLSLEMVDKNTGRSSGLLSSITSFLANWLVVRNDNVGTDARRGSTVMRLPDDVSVMQTMWFPLRKGLGEVVGF